MLTLGTMETTAREEELHNAGNGDDGRRSAVREKRAVRAARASPRRFLSPGDAGEQGEDYGTHGDSDRKSVV